MTEKSLKRIENFTEKRGRGPLDPTPKSTYDNIRELQQQRGQR